VRGATMESSQSLVLISSGLLSVGLASVAAGSLTFRGSSKKTVSEITKKNTLPWSPSELLGSGSGGRSPIFGLMWSIIYLWCAVCVVILLYAGLSKQNPHNAQGLSWSCLCCFLALLLASFWNIVFIQNKSWSFVLSAVILLLITLSLGVAVYFTNPFVHKSISWFENVTGMFFSFFMGWSLIALGLSLGTATRFYSRGESRLDEEQSSWWPFSLGVLTLILSAVYTNGFLSIPLVAASLFFRGFTRHWQVWSSTVLAVVGVGVGIVLMLIRRG